MAGLDFRTETKMAILSNWQKVEQKSHKIHSSPTLVILVVKIRI
jgi:hypothetical protein